MSDEKDAERWRWIEKRLKLGPTVGSRNEAKRRYLISDGHIGSGSENCQTVADAIDECIEKEKNERSVKPRARRRLSRSNGDVA